jgi:hypothetical protein
LNYNAGIVKALKDSSTVSLDILPVLTGHSVYSVAPEAQR